MTDRERVLELMDEAEVVYLATVSGAAPRIRIVANLRRPDVYPATSEACRKAGFTVYFATSLASGKVRDIRENPIVAAYYAIPAKSRAVMLSGRAEIVTDLDVKKALWDEKWRSHWPGGVDDPNFAVLRLVPARAEGWWGPSRIDFEVAET
jgi:general stress protein 26